MSYLDFLGPINPGDNDYQKFAKTQAQLHLACLNASIPINPVTNPLLTDINVGDNDYQKWAKLSAWASNLAQNISSGGGGGSNVQGALVPVNTGTSSLAVAFAAPFASNPTVNCTLVTPDGSTILANPENVSTTGFTAVWGFAIPASWQLSWMATKTTQ